MTDLLDQESFESTDAEAVKNFVGKHFIYMYSSGWQYELYLKNERTMDYRDYKGLVGKCFGSLISWSASDSELSDHWDMIAMSFLCTTNSVLYSILRTQAQVFLIWHKQRTAGCGPVDVLFSNATLLIIISSALHCWTCCILDKSLNSACHSTQVFSRTPVNHILKSFAAQLQWIYWLCIATFCSVTLGS